MPRPHASSQLDICNRFLQERYHYDGEFLPDRFEFDPTLGSRCLYVGCSEASHSARQAAEDDSSESSSDKEKLSREELDEQDSRALSALAIKAVVMNNPFSNAAVGPGLAPGPRRYLGVMKANMLFEMLRRWCSQSCLSPAPSWTTFRRALTQARPWLRFRKSQGQHGNCDSCTWFKQQLRACHNLGQRAQLVEQYAEHLLQNWRDRQADAVFHAQSVQGRSAAMKLGKT